jgi:hypothetical protein
MGEPFGDSRFLYNACYNRPKQQANIVLLELAIHLRLFEDVYGLPETWKHAGGIVFGKVFKLDGKEEELYFRDMTNKIIHTTSIDWDLSNPDNPVIVSHSDNPARWLKAEIQIHCLVAFCSNLQM